MLSKSFLQSAMSFQQPRKLSKSRRILLKRRRMRNSNCWKRRLNRRRNQRKKLMKKLKRKKRIQSLG